MDWSKVLEVFFGAGLAFIFGFALQYWLVRRQEQFQKQLLKQQLDYQERMERQRSEQDERAEKARQDAAASIAALNRENERKIAMDNRNFESRLRSRDRLDKRMASVLGPRLILADHVEQDQNPSK